MLFKFIHVVCVFVLGGEGDFGRQVEAKPRTLFRVLLILFRMSVDVQVLDMMLVWSRSLDTAAAVCQKPGGMSEIAIKHFQARQYVQFTTWYSIRYPVFCQPPPRLESQAIWLHMHGRTF